MGWIQHVSTTAHQFNNTLLPVNTTAIYNPNNFRPNLSIIYDPSIILYSSTSFYIYRCKTTNSLKLN